jgi:hypothetical protein
VHDNAVGVSQTGVAIVGNNANVFDNDIFDSQIFDGIELIGDEDSRFDGKHHREQHLLQFAGKVAGSAGGRAEGFAVSLVDRPFYAD